MELLSQHTEGFTGRQLTDVVATALLICEAKLLNCKHLHVIEGVIYKVHGNREDCKEPNCFQSAKQLINVSEKQPLCYHDLIFAIRAQPYQPPYVIEGITPENENIPKHKTEKMVVKVRPRK